jgi:hypothetical protein
MVRAKTLLLTASLLVVAAFLTVGCRRNAPVINPTSPMPVMEKVSEKDIKAAIIRAGADKNWVIVPTGPQKLEGRLQTREHSAVVEITYDRHNYTITYKNSVNLQYQDGTIHSNYNRWVLGLENEIRRQLAALNAR